MAAPYGGLPLIADTSAWTAVHRARKLGNVPADWLEAAAAGQLCTSPVVRLELLHSTRNLREFDQWNSMLALLREIQLTNSAAQAAISALRDLAAESPGYHRVGLGDALIAASAQEAGVGVLHYNFKDFDRLAEVLSFASVPLGAPGEFEIDEDDEDSSTRKG
jgi:predicted nucleic acid-binding protein